MFAIIVGTHGRLAEELLASVDMIFGEVQNTAAVTFLPGEGSADITAKYEAALEKVDASGGALFLVDIFGGTPYNTACRIVINNEKYGIVTGASLPMLADMVNAQMMDEGTDIRALMEKAAGAGQKGIRLFHTSTVNA
ncbi:PTS sugar transporter subunit IIA [Selenomonas sp.]|uniref:PTS sugar transporter subunit IIA n=1 Tax=Selenomonas sp. TaxID=2053611 RepID=UPI003FA1B49A